MEKDLAGFQLWLAQKGRKVGTVRGISYNLKRVLRSGTKLTAKGVASYLFLMKEQGKTGAYLNNILTAIHLYAQYKHLPALLKIHRFKIDPYVQATMSDDEITQFLDLPCPTCRLFTHGHELQRQTNPKRWEKMHMFWSIAAYTGMRTGEVAHLKVEDVDWGRNVFILTDTKTNTPRFVPIAPNIEKELHEYIAELTTDYLFPSPRGGNHNGTGQVIDNVDWHYDFHRRLKRLGIKRKNLTPYSLRPSFITRLLEEDVNIFKVQKLVGHKRLETTAHYTHLTTKDIQEAIKKHPIIRRATDPKSIIHSLEETIHSYALDQDSRFDPVLLHDAIGAFVGALYQAIYKSN